MKQDIFLFLMGTCMGFTMGAGGALAVYAHHIWPRLRPGIEVRTLISTLDRHNAALSDQIRADPERADELAPMFNQNSTFLCALKWVTGEDTIRVTERPLQ